MENTTLPIALTPHTVFVLCGPTMCGKSTFAEKLRDVCTKQSLTFSLLSSDNYRGLLLEISSNMNWVEEDLRHSPASLAVSESAFECLFSDLKLSLKFPVCADIVVVDTTGFDQKFRDDVCEIATNRGYKTCLITFEYKKRADYLLDSMTAPQKEVVERSRFKYNTQVLPSLRRGHFDSSVTVKSRYTNPVCANETELLTCKQNYIGRGRDFAVIGDSHECVEELKLLMAEVEKISPNIAFVHIGDYLDKGNNTLAMVDFMYSRYQAGDVIIRGNHENYIVKALGGHIKTRDADLEARVFQSAAVLAANPEYTAKVFEIWENSVPFFIIEQTEVGGLPVYITHAPCSIKYLGKVHNEALSAQRNYRIKDRTVKLQDDLEWLTKEASSIHPLHIFGHIAHRVKDKILEKIDSIKLKNKVFLDTGAVYGGHLTAVILKNGSVETIVSQACPKRDLTEIPSEFISSFRASNARFDIRNYELEGRDLALLRGLQTHGIKYISGTMSPGPSNGDELEPLDATLDYLQKGGVKEVVLEPKFMGSRCQVYLFKGAPEKTFGVSRSGWRIRSLEGCNEEQFQAFWESLAFKYVSLTEAYGDMILDGELLPWRALGGGLVDEAFISYQALIENELGFLTRSERPSELDEFFEGLPNKVAHLEAFKVELAKFAQKAEPSFQAFEILSPEIPSLPSTYDRFLAVNQDYFPLVVNLEEPESRVKAAEFLQLTADASLEGVVIKPTDPANYPIPYIKVRNPNYLRLVYGYDYPDRIGKLCRQKKIQRKVNLSKAEHYLATKMLFAPEADREMYAVKMICEMKQEVSLDPRL